jgi:hypothetical protein
VRFTVVLTARAISDLEAARDKNGSRRILFVTPDGKRPIIRLGKVSQRTAEGINRVEQLLEARQAERTGFEPADQLTRSRV